VPLVPLCSLFHSFTPCLLSRMFLFALTPNLQGQKGGGSTSPSPRGRAFSNAGCRSIEAGRVVQHASVHAGDPGRGCVQLGREAEAGEEAEQHRCRRTHCTAMPRGQGGLGLALTFACFYSVSLPGGDIQLSFFFSPPPRHLSSSLPSSSPNHISPRGGFRSCSLHVPRYLDACPFAHPSISTSISSSPLTLAHSVRIPPRLRGTSDPLLSYALALPDLG
jgi:hypothetical protein